MRIAYLSSAEIPSRSAHSLQVMKMCQAMSAEGHAVTLFAPPAGGSDDARDLARWYGVGLDFAIRRVSLPPVLARRGLGRSLAVAGAALAPDLIYTRGIDIAWFAARRGLPVILEIHHPPTGRLGPLFFRSLAGRRPIVPMLAISAHLVELLRNGYPQLAGREILVAPDAVDLERYQNLPPAKEARRQQGFAERPTAGYFGSLVAGRGVELILEAARLRPHTEFLMFGGEERAVADWRARESRPNIHWFGHVPNADVPRYQAACDALLMPYQRTVSIQGKGNTAGMMSPLKLFEYLAAERPILASDLPALRTVLGGANSVLLPCDRPEEWAAALDRVERELAWARALARQARRDAEEHTWRGRVREILQFASEPIAARSRAKA